MKKEELNSLRLDKEFIFSLYNGIQKVGIAVESGNDFYIVSKHDVNKENCFEKGYKVKPEQIEKCEVYEPADFSRKNPPISISYSHTYYAKKMVIVGAGASYNFCSANNYDKKKQIPLTNDLFSDVQLEILNNYPGALNLSSDIRRVTDIEQYFQNQWESIQKIYDPLQMSKLINTQYYLQKLLRTKSIENYKNRDNNYWILANFLHQYIKYQDSREKILLVNFNYDTMLEEALNSSLKYTYTNIDDYVDYENKKLLLFKPHGSWNWIKKFMHEFMQNKPFGQYMSPYQFSDYIYKNQLTINQLQSNLKNEIEVVDQFHKEDNLFFFFYPWILIPFKDKDEFVMPKKHTRIFEDFLPGLEEILIIGWKGSEEHFNKTLSKKLYNKKIKITYINHTDHSIRQNIQEYSNDINWVDHKDLNIEPTFTALADHLVNNKDFWK